MVFLSILRGAKDILEAILSGCRVDLTGRWQVKRLRGNTDPNRAVFRNLFESRGQIFVSYTFVGRNIHFQNMLKFMTDLVPYIGLEDSECIM